MNPHYTDDAGAVTLYHGDCRQVLADLPDASVDSVVTDPPYELAFMGRKWDASGIAYDTAMWAEVLRVLKPGGHLLAFGGTRTWHRMVCAIEDAGFEVRDSLQWIYGSGFPKSLDVSKAIESTLATGKSNSRSLRSTEQAGGGELYTLTGRNNGIMGEIREYQRKKFTPTTAEAERWQGWGTALKPAVEPICLARKPLEGTVAGNVLEWGTGALNIDGCRIGTGGQLRWSSPRDMGYSGGTDSDAVATESTLGRWPANVLLDEEAAAMLDQQSGELTSGKMAAGTRPKGDRKTYGQDARGGYVTATDTPGDTGGASRFFYVAKAPQHERPRLEDGTAHPTVKPVALMRWLVRLVTPPGGLVLDPFAGTGTTAEAALVEGFRCVLIEAEADHLPLIVQRLTKPIQPTLI